MPTSVSYEVALQGYQRSIALIEKKYPEQDTTELSKQLIDISQLDKHDRVPIRIISQNAETMQRLLHDPLFAIKVVDSFDYSSIPIVQLFSKQFTRERGKEQLGEMIIFLAGYYAAVTEVADVHLTWQKNTISVDLIPCESYVSGPHMEASVFAIYKLLNMLTECKPKEVHFTHRNGAPLADYEPYFRIQPQFNNHSNSLVFEAKQRFEGVYSESSDAVAGLNLLLQQEFPNISIVEQCKAILKSIMHFGEPSRERVAGMLDISVSTLGRRLLEHDVVFKDLLLEMRKEMAVEMLIKQNLKAPKVAFLLGYHTLSHFYRAFKSWFGVSVGDFKKQENRQSEA